MADFGKRLSEERKRLGLNQTEFGRIGGVTKTSQVNYESGERSPNVDYWQAIAAAGADVQYILTGMRSGEQIKVAPAPEPQLDMALLSMVIAELEAALKRHQRVLDPERKARAVSVLYEYFSKAGPQEAATIDRVLEMMN